jgi:hypothetical protein
VRGRNPWLPGSLGWHAWEFCEAGVAEQMAGVRGERYLLAKLGLPIDSGGGGFQDLGTAPRERRWSLYGKKQGQTRRSSDRTH